MKAEFFSKTIIFTVCFALMPLFLYSEDPKQSHLKGIEFGKQKRYDEAIVEFDKSLGEYNKTSSKVLHNKAWALESKNNIPEAITAYEEAVRRNPAQIQSYERLGYLYYQTTEYEKAVDTGEKVLKLDMNNKEVIKWLPDAYRLKLQKQQELLAKQKEEEQKKKEEVKKEAVVEEQKEEEKEPRRYIYVSLEAMVLRTAYYFQEVKDESTGEVRESKGFKYVVSPGAYTNIPETFTLIATPMPGLEIDIIAGKPYLGALSPNLAIHSEIMQVIYSLGDYSIGLGCMGNHYRSSFNYGELKTMHDYKAGFIFGYTEDKARVDFYLYPRAVPKDGESSSGKTFDTDYVEMKYRYDVDKILHFYSWMNARDYYFFDHDQKISNYWGVYEFGLGILLGKYKFKSDPTKHVSISFDYTERFYMMDVNNDKPYHFANGQGWFGVNADKWFEGDPFSGYRAPGHVFSLKVEEGLNEHFFLYQKLSAEMVDRREDHDEYCIVLGLGGAY